MATQQSDCALLHRHCKDLRNGWWSPAALATKLEWSIEHTADVLVDLEMAGQVVVWDSPGGLLIACLGGHEADERADDFYIDPTRIDKQPDSRPSWARDEPTWPYLIVGSTMPGFAKDDCPDACGGRELKASEYCICCDRPR